MFWSVSPNHACMRAALGRLVDEVATLFMVMTEKQRGFSRTRPGPPLPYDQLLAEAAEVPPRFVWPEGASRRTRVSVELPHLGRETYFDLIPATGTADTLLVYHHGLGEIPHDTLPRALRFASRRLRERCDIVVIKGLQHEHMHAVSDLIADRELFSRCLVASASLARAIADQRRAAYAHRALFGTSMGGVISLIEAGRDPRFDLYVPLVAGPDLADVLLESVFSRLVQGRYLRRARKAEWRDRLDLTSHFSPDPGPPIRPLLGEADLLFRIEQQRAGYARIPRARVTTCPGGHITACVRADNVLRHLLRQLEAECWSPAPAPQPHRAPVGAA